MKKIFVPHFVLPAKFPERKSADSDLRPAERSSFSYEGEIQMKKEHNSRAITLIALVITVIILLILAVFIISLTIVVGAVK